MMALHFHVNMCIWYCILMVGAVDAIWLWNSGMSMDITRSAALFGILFGCLGVSLFYRYIRKDDRIFFICQITSQLISGTLFLAMLSYLSSRLDLPLVDAQLIAADHWLFFDWRHWVEMWDQWPVMSRICSVAYISAAPQISLILALLFLHGDIAQIQRFVVAFFYSGLAVIIIAALFPAMGGYIYYSLDPTHFQYLHPAAGRIHEDALVAMRNHSITTMTLDFQGLVTFPSFHAVLAILLIYASLPIRWLAAILIPVNVLMLLSTPGDGGHYLVDVIAGIILAWQALAFAKHRLPEANA